MSPDLVLLPRVSYRGQEIAGPRLQALIALLAGDLRSGCGAAGMIEELWPDEQPENPAKALQILVTRARAQLGTELIARTTTGYRLTLPDHQIDTAAILTQAAAAAECSRAGDHAGALSHADAGLTLWADPGPTDDPRDPLTALRTERRTTYKALLRTRLLTLARLDRPAEAIDGLITLTAERPRDEELLVELLRCEAKTVSPAAALIRYDAYRRALRDELGTDPGAGLQAEHRRLLQATAPTVRRGVEHAPNQLLGRDDDIAAVQALLRDSRVTSIVGPGGIGKTRLAQVIAGRAEVPSVTVVPLAGLVDAADVAREVATALGVGEPRRPGGLTGTRDATTATPAAATLIATALAVGPSLLVLDNCEHLLEGAAELVRALVATTAELRILTTSRIPLGLSSESVHLLPELSLPAGVELFGQRARAAGPGVDLPAAEVEELCRRLDGLPLAVELAAARTRIMPVAEISRRLEDRFGLLRGGARDSPQRHQTLHAVVDWSWNLLDPAGRAAMRALSAYADGFTVDAARTLLAALPTHDATDVVAILEQLVDHSLIKLYDVPPGTRLRMLETVREFSAEQLAAAGDSEDVTAAYLVWARTFGLANHENLLGPDPFDTAAAVRQEQENLSHALRLAIARDDHDAIAAVAAVLGALWTLEANYPRLAMLLDQISRPLSHYRPGPAYVEAARTALTMAVGYSFSTLGPQPTRALVALRRLTPGRADTMVRAMDRVIDAYGDPAALERLCDSTEPLLAGAANLLGSFHHELAGDVEPALESAQRAVPLFDAEKLPWPITFSHARVAELYLRLEQGAEARDHLTPVLPMLERLGAWADAAGVRSWLVLANLQLGDTAEAERWLDGLAQVVIDADQDKALGYDLAVRAEVAFARGEAESGLRLWRHVVDLVRDDGANLTTGLALALDPWVVEARSAAVVAHARHGRLDLVVEVRAALPLELTNLLTHPMVNPPPNLAEQAICGTQLLAIGIADCRRARVTGDPRLARSAVSTVALAERFGFLRTFCPTMSAAAARRDAEQTDRTAYDEALSSYAGLGPAGLRAAALELLG